MNIFNWISKQYTFILYILLVVFPIILLLLWTYIKAKKDKSELCFIELDDNYPNHEYRYCLTTYTHNRKHSGTNANVAVKLIGTKRSSSAHLIQTGASPVLCSGSVNTFLITTKHCLGDIKKIRLWHDNSGSYPEWYLKKLSVRDLERNTIWFFFTNTIFDYVLDHTFTASTSAELLSFSTIFTNKWESVLQDRHVWSSLFNMNWWNGLVFTRFQRTLTCFMSVSMIMLTSLILHLRYTQFTIISYEAASDTYIFQWWHIVIGIQSSLMTYPLFLITQQLFRLSQKDPYDLQSHMPQYKSTIKPNSKKKKDSIEDFFAKLELPETASELHKDFIEESLDEKEPSSSSLPEKCLDEEKTASFTIFHKDPFSGDEVLPNSFIVISWILSVAVIFVSFIACISLGRTLLHPFKWIVSVISGTIFTIYLLETTTCFFFLIYSIATERKIDLKSWVTPIIIQNAIPKSKESDYASVKFRKAMSSLYQPPNREMITEQIKKNARLRLNRRRRILASTHIFYLSLLIIIAFSSHSTDDFFLNRFLKEEIITKQLDLVTDRESCYDWIVSYRSFFNKSSLISHQLLLLTSHFRQKRVKETNLLCEWGSFKSPKSCHKMFSISNEEQNSFRTGWFPLSFNTTCKSPWIFQKEDLSSLNSFKGELGTYSTGGFYLYFNENCSAIDLELKDHNWIDKYTRIILFEAVIFSIPAKLYIVTQVGVEFSHFGVVKKSHNFYLFRSHYLRNYADYIPFVCMLLLLAISFVKLYKISSQITTLRLQFFKSFSKVLQLFNFLSSFFAIILFLTRTVYYDEAIWKLSNGLSSFKSFFAAAYFSEIVQSLLASSIFFSLIYLIKILRGHPLFELFNFTYHRAANGLLRNAFLLSVIYTAFCVTALWQFGYMDDFKNLINSMQSIFALGMDNAYPALGVLKEPSISGYIFLFAYILLVIQGLLGITVSIYEDSYRECKLLMRKTVAKKDLQNFSFKQLRSFIKLRRTEANF